MRSLPTLTLCRALSIASVEITLTIENLRLASGCLRVLCISIGNSESVLDRVKWTECLVRAAQFFTFACVHSISGFECLFIASHSSHVARR